ncbi:hypothetical protein [Burkholderia gladioli]|nr:hypothetical protein [Burkholderia gladioli]
MSPESIRRLILIWAARLGTGAFVATLVRSPFSAKARHTLGGRWEA